MTKTFSELALILALLLPAAPGASAPTEPGGLRRSQNEWVYFDANGKLAYKSLPAGDRIMDFSSAGYMGGGVALPSVPVKVTIAPSDGDDTEAIQSALDTLAKSEPAGGFRGAVLLRPGTYNCSRTINLSASGVVLRGSGSGAVGTVLKMTGSPHLCILVAGLSGAQPAGEPARIRDAYVPSGATSVTVEHGSQFKAGDSVLILRPVTSSWVKFMGMDGLFRNGRRETWLAAGSRTASERTVTSVEGDRLALDLPLGDSFDSKYMAPPGGTVVKSSDTGRIFRVGVESLQIIAPPQTVEISERHYQAIRMRDLADAWVRDVAIIDTVNSVGIGAGARRVTVENLRVTHTVATKGAAKPADFSTDGSQVLFHRCSATGDNLFYFVTGARVTGPNVLLNCRFRGNGHIQPHARWATGLLVDGCEVSDSGIDFMNRGEMGSGHGWTIGWAVAWNCVARSYIFQQPPGSMNWAIGCRGAREKSSMPFGHQPSLAEATFDSHGTPVTPASLYLAQLAHRLGPQAVKALGY
ncbi:MAG TPA: hypothetical protein VNZ64_21045 [Candidatus Acidoferrum sp.]|nr:hypothetical protein [Candidatus Acidoferrum sp.]